MGTTSASQPTSDEPREVPMATVPLSLEERLTDGDLIATLRSRAEDEGANPTDWPGLTIYRFDSPVVPQWSVVDSLSICVVAQGRKSVVVDGDEHRYDPFNYLVLSRGMRFQAEILQASIEKPFLSFVLQVDPAIVRRVSSDMRERAAVVFGAPPRLTRPPRPPAARVSPLDADLGGALLRFIRATDSSTDQRVLAPVYLQEIVYRVLQADQWRTLLQAASSEDASNPVAHVIAHIRAHLAEPLSVTDLAEVARMSPSAFSHLFRDVTGVSPYSFIKNVRLERARELLVGGGMNVGEVARAVGYSSLSHFINEFKRHFGVTPRSYVEGQRGVVPLRMDLSTGSAPTAEPLSKNA